MALMTTMIRTGMIRILMALIIIGIFIPLMLVLCMLFQAVLVVPPTRSLLLFH